jgi:hypothetical protein
MSSYTRPIKPARHAEPHHITMVGGKTWGQRMSDKQKFMKTIRPDPIEYFNEQHVRHSTTTENMQTLEDGMSGASGKTYYMNTPADSRFKSHLLELGKYQRPQLEGMYNQHENLQDGSANMMNRRIRHGMV